MKDKNTVAIGEIFKYKDVSLRCKLHTGDSCKGCYFEYTFGKNLNENKRDMENGCYQQSCFSFQRDDDKNVIFEKVSKEEIIP